MAQNVKNRTALFAALLILFLDTFGFAYLLPLLPILFQAPTSELVPPASLESTRHFLLGLVLVAYPLTQTVGAPIFGGFADRFGRKKILLWTLLGTLAGHILCALSLVFFLYPLLLIGRLITGFFSGTLAICMAIIADQTSQKLERSYLFGSVAATIGLAWALSFWIELLRLPNPSLFFWSMAFLTIVNLCVLIFMYKEPAREKNHHLCLFSILHKMIRVFEGKQARTLLIVLFFWGFGYIISLQWGPSVAIFRYQAAQEQIGWLMAIWPLTWVLAGAILIRPLFHRFSHWPLTLWCLFALGLILFADGASDFFPYFALSSVLGAIFGSIAWTAIVSLLSNHAPQNDQALTFGVIEGVLAFAHFLSPTIGGLLAGISLEPLLYACSLLVFIAFLILLVYVFRRKTRPFV